jgi:hypothetical protein
MPPGGRFVEARRCRRLGWLGPGGCSFGLPVPPRYISLARQGCYRALPMGWRAARTLPPFGAADDSLTVTSRGAQIRSLCAPGSADVSEFAACASLCAGQHDHSPSDPQVSAHERVLARHKGKVGSASRRHKPVTKHGRSVHAPWTRAERVPYRGPLGVSCRGDTGALLVKRYFST